MFDAATGQSAEAEAERILASLPQPPRSNDWYDALLEIVVGQDGPSDDVWRAIKRLAGIRTMRGG